MYTPYLFDLDNSRAVTGVNSTNHPPLWKILRAFGFSAKVGNILKDMYADQISVV